MIFDFSTVVCFPTPPPSHTLIHHLFMLSVLPLRTTLLPSYSRNLNPHSLTHSLTSSSCIFIPSRRSFHFRFITALSCLFFLLTRILIPAINPSILRKRCTLAGRFLLAVRYSCLSTPFAGRRGIVSRHYVFLGSPAAFAAGASKSKTRFDRQTCVYYNGRVTPPPSQIDSNCSCSPCKLWNFGYKVHLRA